jgi:hypothetical protein
MQWANNLFDPSPIGAFVPSKLAKRLPALTTTNLPTLLATFKVSKNRRMATIMASSSLDPFQPNSSHTTKTTSQKTHKII